MKNKVLFGVCVLFGLMFINAGLNKYFNYMPPPPDLPEAQMNMFVSMMSIGWLIPLIGAIEVIGGILFMIPRFRALGALLIAPILTGILLTHLTVAPSGLPMVAILILIFGWVVADNLKKYLPIVRS